MKKKNTSVTPHRARMLAIKKVSIAADKRTIVRNVSLTIRPGEIHLLMGPNGSGKSTLLNAIAGSPRTKMTQGSLVLDGISLTRLPSHVRAQNGIFLGFQHPVDIAGVTMAAFLRSAKNAMNQSRCEKTFSPTDFAELLKNTLGTLKMDERFGSRQVNAGLSGGEKKKGELLQMALLEPRYALLDEFDSGLDVDALRHVADIIKTYAQKGVGFLLVSHNPKLQELLPLDAVHIMNHGSLTQSGGSELMQEIAKKGFITTP